MLPLCFCLKRFKSIVVRACVFYLFLLCVWSVFCCVCEFLFKDIQINNDVCLCVLCVLLLLYVCVCEICCRLLGLCVLMRLLLCVCWGGFFFLFFHNVCSLFGLLFVMSACFCLRIYKKTMARANVMCVLVCFFQCCVFVCFLLCLCV